MFLIIAIFSALGLVAAALFLYIRDFERRVRDRSGFPARARLTA